MKFVTCSRHCLAAFACASSLLVSQPVEAAETFSARQFYRQANAEERAGNVGLAIRDYERATLLAPGEPAIAHNLQLAKDRAGVATRPTPAWERPITALSLNALAILVSICLLLLSLLIFGTRLIPVTIRRASGRVGVAAAAVAMLACAAIAWRSSELDRAIVVAAAATLHLAPAEAADAVGTLKGGNSVTTQRTHGEFAYVRTAGGEHGWVRRSEIAPVIPHT
jgi:hypothetical protein